MERENKELRESYDELIKSALNLDRIVKVKQREIERLNLIIKVKTKRIQQLMCRLDKRQKKIREVIDKIENTTINCDGKAEDLLDDIYEILKGRDKE